MKLAAQQNNPPDSRLGNKAELAEFFGIHLGTLDAWLRRGCPYRQRGSRGKSWEFDYLEVAQWRFGGVAEETSDNPEDMPPKERLDWYRGCRERDAHRKDLGELLDAQEVVKAWTGLVQVAKDRLMALPMRLAPVMLSMDDMRQIEDKLKAEILSVLEELADGEK